MGFEPAIVDY